jgi:hypothetical protein
MRVQDGDIPDGGALEPKAPALLTDSASTRFAGLGPH